MSILYENELGFYISHAKLIENIYENVQIDDNDNKQSFCYKKNLFEINNPYKPLKTFKKLKETVESKTKGAFDVLENEQAFVIEKFNELIKVLKELKHFKTTNYDSDNKTALNLAEQVYKACKIAKISNLHGNAGTVTCKNQLNENDFIFPKNAEFYCFDVSNINEHLENKKFDVILMDPPWWNKYIRRKRKKSDHAYQMMYNTDLGEIPIENLLENNGILIVWCTNSLQHINCLKNELFAKWGLKYLATWFWVKITKNGEPVCNFNKPPGKQPYERIIFATKSENNINIPNQKLIISVPSALHSHKPPLTEVVKAFLPENAKSLEIFARYLLPNWTSYGLEAILLQNVSLFEEIPC